MKKKESRLSQLPIVQLVIFPTAFIVWLIFLTLVVGYTIPGPRPSPMPLIMTGLLAFGLFIFGTGLLKRQYG